MQGIEIELPDAGEYWWAVQCDPRTGEWLTEPPHVVKRLPDGRSLWSDGCIGAPLDDD